MRNDTLKLIVGPTKECLFIPGEYLIHSSKLIRHILKTRKIESRTGTIDLPDEDEVVFQEYLRFIYSDRLPTEDHASSDPLKWEKSSGKSYKLLAELYVVGERMIDRRIQDAIMRELVRLSHIRLANGTYRFPGNDVPFVIYEGTTQNDPARRLLMQMYARFGGKQWLSNHDDFHPDFAIDFVRALFRNVTDFSSIASFRHGAIAVEDFLFANEANAQSRLFQTKISDFYPKRHPPLPPQPPVKRIKIAPCAHCGRGY